MLHPETCCCCIELRCGCVCIAICDVILRGIDSLLLDKGSLFGFASLIISGIYLVCCVILLIGALLEMRYLLIPYIVAALTHVLIMVCECVYTIVVDDFYDFMVFDILQAVLSTYFALVVHSYYSSLS